MTIALLLPVIPLLLVSVAVIVWLLSVFKVAVKLSMPVPLTSVQPHYTRPTVWSVQLVQAKAHLDSVGRAISIIFHTRARTIGIATALQRVEG